MNIYKINFYNEISPGISSVVDPGCLSWIPDQNFSIPDPELRVKKILDPGYGSASKNF
jgi:hypothetical protein